MESMLAHSSLLLIWAIFLAAGAVTWAAGITLAKATDTVDTRWKIGEALGGLVLLGISGSLPEIAVVWSAAVHLHYDVIIGNLIGGLSIQTLVIVIFDLAVRGKRPLAYHAGSRMLYYETLFAIIITVLALGGMFIPKTHNFFHMSPATIAIVLAWFGGLFLINKARLKPGNETTADDTDPTADDTETTPDDKEPGRLHHHRRAVENHPFYANKSTGYVLGAFAVASILTLIAGVLLEETGTAIATRMNIGSGLFAATAIALITSLPEISTGLESIFIGDNNLAISDIMGGNAFMLVVFLLADLIAKKPVLAFSQHTDMFLTVLAIAMMTVYMVAFIHPPKIRILRMGWDSICQIVIYIAGMFGFSFIK